MDRGFLVDLETMDYEEAFSFQEEVRRARASSVIPDTLILGEHPPVYTVGRDGGYDHLKVGPGYLKEIGVKVHQATRGGSITFHGYGQLVAYPVMHVERFGGDLLNYLRLLEELIIRVLQEYGINGARFKPHTGVWVEQEKIASIGVACRESVTTHGFALNVSTDLRYFRMINPCGITDCGVTSMLKLLPGGVKLNAVKQSVRTSFADVFGFSLCQVSRKSLLGLFRHAGDEDINEGKNSERPAIMVKS